jgi:thiamine kinase-like enzyme
MAEKANAKAEELGEIIAQRNGRTIYAKGDRVTKVFSHEKYAVSDVMKEAMNQAYALECGFNAPALYKVYPLGEDWAIESQRIQGKTLEQMIREDPSHEKKYISMLVQIQVKLLGHLSDNLKLPKLKDKLNNYITHSGLDATTRYDLHVRLEKMPNHYKFCHGDLAPHNIIIDDKGEAWILDWAHATRGNSSADAAMTYLLFLLAGDEKGAQMYLREFCRKTDIAAQYVQQWISVVSATKLATTSDEKQREQLLKNINVVEY